MGLLPEAVTGPLLLGDVGEGVIAEHLARFGLVTLLGKRIREDKLEGIAKERVAALAGLPDLVLVEADGARGRSLKLPASHEPVIPEVTGTVLVLAGLDVLGAPLGEETVHRLSLVEEASGCAPGDSVTQSALVRTLLHPTGYLSRLPMGARCGVFLNKAESHPSAREIAAQLVPPYAFAAYGSARNGAFALVTSVVSSRR
jgi:probable selenium-dependent hydroxylase accessory protein YqeC